MNIYRKAITISVLTLITGFAKADEGQWIPMLIDRNISEMQQMGCRLSADDIYSANHTSIKDAIVIFGKGCTGEIVSDKGLILTNHHCGYDAIQKHSSVQFDYLTNGFWAKGQDQELPNPGLTATLLVNMSDVTARILDGTKGVADDGKRSEIINKNIKAVTDSATSGTHYEAIVKPFFKGNQYLLFVNEVFTDIRLVGAPPSAIGKFGGDTDNWMWPRHTGDFSIFRIYADKDNKPAEFSPNNVPYKPKKHLTISTKGVTEGDFTMVLGYPGTTNEYAPSYQLEMIANAIDPALIELRTAKLNVMNRHQNADKSVRIKYASKNASTSNAWKKWKGEIAGLKRINAFETKRNYENKFQKWAESTAERESKYGNILSSYAKIYPEYEKALLTKNYISELCYRDGVETFDVAGILKKLIVATNDNSVDEEILATTIKEVDDFYKNYDSDLDCEMSAAVIDCYIKNIDLKYQPTEFIKLKTKEDILKKVNQLFSKSWLDNSEKITLLLNNWNKQSANTIEKDPIYKLYREIESIYAGVYNETEEVYAKLKQLDKDYMLAQMEFEPQRQFYPDANFTLRITYGKVAGYEPKDGVTYKYLTTLDGIIEKDNPDIYDYKVPEKLKQLYAAKDYGRYAVNGKIPTCFVATNHTTGGNSGSPVLNANGQLVGINFDRAWDGVMSDMIYNRDICRNISLDIRYLLFLVDKFADAKYLIDEMDIVD